MIIAGKYSFNNGSEVLREKYPVLLGQIEEIIRDVSASRCKTKKSKEKTMQGRLLYSPMALNKAFKKHFVQKSLGEQESSM